MRSALVRLSPSGTHVDRGSPDGGVSFVILPDDMPEELMEPLVINHAYTSQFGTTLTGQESVAEVQDALASGQARMDQLGAAYAAFAPTWVNQDHPSMIDWTADWTTLQNRWKAAVDKANTAVSVAKVNVFTPNSMIPAQAEYDGLLKALRACAPPDGCPIVKGDWDDLNDRLDKAKGSSTQYALPQPTATDVSQQLYAATSGVDIVAQASGQEAPKNALGTFLHNVAGPGGSGPSAVKWAFIGVGAGMGGVVGMKLGGLVGTLIGMLVGGGAVELMSLEMASVTKGASSAAKTTVAKSLLTP